MPKPKIIIVDDDADFRAPINIILSHEGMIVREASSAAEMDEILNEFDADMILLDVKLPGEDGLSIVKRIKRRRPVDVVMLSGLGDVEHRIEGLSSGADYYLSKPIDMRELLAVIQNRFMSQTMNDIKQAHDWVLDTKLWQLRTPDGEFHSLNSTELAILKLLAEHSRLGKPATKEALYEALGKRYLPESRSLDLHVSRMRQRFSVEGEPFPIKTLRNIGYELTEAVTII